MSSESDMLLLEALTVVSACKQMKTGRLRTLRRQTTKRHPAVRAFIPVTARRLTSQTLCANRG